MSMSLGRQSVVNIDTTLVSEISGLRTGRERIVSFVNLVDMFAYYKVEVAYAVSSC